VSGGAKSKDLYENIKFKRADEVNNGSTDDDEKDIEKVKNKDKRAAKERERREREKKAYLEK